MILSIESLYLWSHICLAIPDQFKGTADEYLRIIYSIMNNGLAGSVIPRVIGCYSRKFMPTVRPSKGRFIGCIISDFHYIEYLIDLATWSRTGNAQNLEAIFCKYMINKHLLEKDYLKASFFEWLFKNRMIMPLPDQSDIKTAYIINLIAMMHEASHFISGSDEFEALFAEHGIDMVVKDANTVIREGKCDFSGLAIVLLASSERIIPFTKEEIIDMYFKLIMANSMYAVFFESKSAAEVKAEEEQDMDRIYSTVRFLKGMDSLFKGLDWEIIKGTDVIQSYLEGIKHIHHFMVTKLPALADEFNGIAQFEKQAMIEQIEEKEKELIAKRNIIVFPETSDPIYMQV